MFAGPLFMNRDESATEPWQRREGADGSTRVVASTEPPTITTRNMTKVPPDAVDADDEKFDAKAISPPTTYTTSRDL